MGLNFEKTEKPEIVEEYDIIADRNELSTQLASSKEVDTLVSTIELNNMSSIVNFGSDATNKISTAADTVLNSMTLSELDRSSEMLKTLNKIMSKFDIAEINDKPSGITGIFSSAKKRMEKMLKKYNTMGEEIDQVYVQLKQYESEINRSNTSLAQMFDSNVNHYHELVKYILAGEQGCREMQEYIGTKEAELERTQDNSIRFQIEELTQCLSLMEQRVEDLRAAENVAMQTIPMIKTMEYTNMNLIRKINSAFIITLPIFKQALAQAMLLKRQSIQAESLAALDQKTNELLIKNANNTVEQSKLTTRLVSGSSIKAETLETTWRTIMNGIEETRNLQDELRVKRADDAKRLESIKEEFLKKYSVPESTIR